MIIYKAGKRILVYPRQDQSMHIELVCIHRGYAYKVYAYNSIFSTGFFTQIKDNNISLRTQIRKITLIS